MVDPQLPAPIEDYADEDVEDIFEPGLVLSPAAREVMSSAWSEHTRRAYRQGWARWGQYCQRDAETRLPADPDVLCNYIGEASTAGMRRATLELTLAAVSFAHRMIGYEDPTRVVEVKLAMQGFRRLSTEEQRQAEGLTLEILAEVRAAGAERVRQAEESLRYARGELNTAKGTLESGAKTGRKEKAELRKRMRAAEQDVLVKEQRLRKIRIRALEDNAMLSLMLDAGLRCSELLGVRWADVRETQSGKSASGVLLVRRAKQRGGTAEQSAADLSGRSIRAVRDLVRQRTGEERYGRIFRFGRTRAVDRLRECLSLAGVEDVERFSMHSGRVGMAQLMVGKGAPDSVVALQGGWKTTGMVLRYTRAQRGGEALRYLG